MLNKYKIVYESIGWSAEMIDELKEAIKRLLANASKYVLEDDKFDNLSTVKRKLQQVDMEIQPFMLMDKATKRLDRIFQEEESPVRFNRKNVPYLNLWYELVDDEAPMTDKIADAIMAACTNDDDGHTLQVVIASWVLSLDHHKIKKTTAINIGSLVAQDAYDLDTAPSAKKGTLISIHEDGTLKFKPKS